MLEAGRATPRGGRNHYTSTDDPLLYAVRAGEYKARVATNKPIQKSCAKVRRPQEAAVSRRFRSLDGRENLSEAGKKKKAVEGRRKGKSSRQREPMRKGHSPPGTGLGYAGKSMAREVDERRKSLEGGDGRRYSLQADMELRRGRARKVVHKNGRALGARRSSARSHGGQNRPARWSFKEKGKGSDEKAVLSGGSELWAATSTKNTVLAGSSS